MSALTREEDLRERNKIAGDLGQKMFDDFVSDPGPYRLAGESFTLAYEEDLEEAGLPADDPDQLIIQRESDGQMFEVELEFVVTRVGPRKTVAS